MPLPSRDAGRKDTTSPCHESTDRLSCQAFRTATGFIDSVVCPWGVLAMRLILSTFAILAVVFYEMSGGSDFQPPQKPEPIAKSEKPATPPSQQLVAASEPMPVLLAEAKPVARSVTPRAEEVDTAESDDKTPELDQVRSSLSAGLTLMPSSNPTGTLQLVSLELGATGLSTGPTDDTAPAPVTEVLTEEEEVALQVPEPDLREVTGTRVNMRDGPGTIYPVVARLNIGTSVEVLSDSGTGWLRLRTLPNRQLGWISASLVSKSGQ